MEIRISRESEVPLRQQLADQVVFLIASDKLKPGESLPSVRELARRLKIHHNTVSEAYQDLVRRTWLVRRRGSRLIVRLPGETAVGGTAPDLDDLINATIRIARDRGFNMQLLRERVQQRMMAQSPDHILVVEQEPGLRRLLGEEIGEALGRPVKSCTIEDLARDRGLVIGALVVTPQYFLADVDPLVPKGYPAVPIAFCGADEHVGLIRGLREASVVAVVSVSESFLRTARSLFAPAVKARHSLCEFLLPLEHPNALRGADLVFCDSVALLAVKHPRRVHHRLIAAESLEYVAGAYGATSD